MDKFRITLGTWVDSSTVETGSTTRVRRAKYKGSRRSSTVRTASEPVRYSAGTYLRVFRPSDSTTHDAYLLLYLRPDGSFLFLGYWPDALEQTLVAGQWSEIGSELRLSGEATVSTAGRPRPKEHFECRFTIGDQNRTPVCA